ncbi:MAG: NAD(P)-binding protein [Elusimicrobiales bacterium]|nr:NAD(P)-binding protein [Elusimicrobiales bacterium]
MLKTDVLIIGGGLAGLSAAKALEGKKSHIVAERENRPGGLSATVTKGGFHFDYSGHLLHLRWPKTSRFILGALGGNCLRLKRDARVFAHRRWTPYPFQANLAGMPGKVKAECVSGFLKAYSAGGGPGDGTEPFSRWTSRVFGAGISRHFMVPYNAKLWRYPLARLTTEWCAPFVPMPRPEEVIEGAYGKRSEGLGYNTVFHYPRRGGIGALANALAMKSSGLRLGLEVESVNLKAGVAMVRHFGPVHFKRLINTSPLDSFVGMAQDAPAAVKRAAAALRHNTVYVLNLGVKGVKSDMHWGYFPGPEFAFYRAGLATNFSRELAPRGCASFYVEFSTAGEALDLASAETAALKGLKACGLLGPGARVVQKLWLKIPCAYVIYNKERAAALPVITAWLKARKAQSIGRYGGWKYSFMEESVKEGLEAADALL